MKIISLVLIAGILLVTQSLRADTPIQARSADNARLIVNRSADFGVDESINLAVDGVQVAVLGINQNYDATLPPGKHVLSISTNPRIYGQDSPNQISVNAEPGKTYTFTAVWDDSESASLEEQ
jgi:predicted alpha-1,6-mannanase (GH76 family)